VKQSIVEYTSQKKSQSPETGFEAFNCLIGNASKSLEKLKAKGMGEHGLSGTYTLCLRQLYTFPDGMTRTQLARHCGVDRAQITRVIGELLAKGIVFEVGGSSNYRKKCVLTEQGFATASEIDALIKKINSFVSGEIPSERLQIFYETLAEICDNLKRAEEFL
jgi:DNA-binding MarR family transcriptional regulator